MSMFDFRQLAATDNFDVSGCDATGYRIGITPTIRAGRPCLGWSCVTYSEVEYLVQVLAKELQDILRQIDSNPNAGLLGRRFASMPSVIDDIGRRQGSSLRFSIFRRDNYRCQICGRNAQEHGVVLEVDHRIPRAKGGTDDPTNLWTLCFECNRGKRDYDL